MSIAGQCPGCSRKFSVPDNFAGKSVRCPQCSRSFVIGSASPISAGAPPARPPASFQLADGPAPAPAVSGGSKKRLLLIGGIGAAGFMGLLCMGCAGLLYFFSGGPANWKEFAPGGGGFTVLMPGAPAQKDRNDPKIISVTPIHEAVAQSPSKISYSVEYYDLAGRPINDYLYLTWLKNQLLADGAKLTQEKDIPPSPYGGKEIVVTLPNNQTLVRRVYLAEARVFWVSAQYPGSPVPPSEVSKFLDSFKITSVAKAPEAPTVVAAKDPPTKKKNSNPPVTKKDPDPPVAKKDANPPPSLPKADFPVSADENAVVTAINRFRGEQKVRLLTLDKQLFEIARANAQADAQGRPSQRAKVQGYTSTFRLAITGARAQTTEQLVDDILKSNFRNQLADAQLKGVGVGLAVDNNGFTRYVMIFGKAN